MRPIQLFVPQFHVDECLAGIRECLERGWTGLGYKTLEFEAAWKEYTKLPHAHFLNSATAGLHLAVKLLKDQYHWSDSDEIITTPLTFVSTNHAILYESMRPVFADVDKYLCLDPLSIERRINRHTRAVMFVGMGGNTGQLKAVSDLCRYYHLALILDAAHMAGTRLDNQHVGGEADISVFSFQAVKNLPTADSGMICCQDADLDARARQLSWLGIDKDTYSRTLGNSTYKWLYDVPSTGYKYHGNSIMAAIALTELKYLDAGNTRRRELAATYDGCLYGVRNVTRVPVAPFCMPSRHLYQVLVDDRDEVIRKLNEREIYPGVHYRDNRLYSMYGYADDCPCAKAASDRLISLPLHLNMTNADAMRVADELIKVTR